MQRSKRNGAADINYAAIGMRVRRFRKARSLTQASLGEKAGVEPFTISHIERGATKLSLPTLVRLANALGTGLDELVYNSIDKNEHITHKDLAAVIDDCTPKEMHAILKVVEVLKATLREI